MHHIYHTEGLILGSRNYGEAGKCHYIFTRDLGMIYASAQGVRKLSSKLRYVLQDYTYVKVDLVQGKDFWRITSASSGDILQNLSKNHRKLKIVFNISRLLKRLLAGEDPNPRLFSDLVKGFSILENLNVQDSFRSGNLENIETIIVLRILGNLGYVGSNEILETFTRSPLEEELVFEVAKKRMKILREINKTLKETHL